MSDKVQKIKEEIERLKNHTLNIQKSEGGFVTSVGRGRVEALNDILKFIDSLPEEPKKQPKFKVGDTIKGPCNNIFQVKEVLDTQYLLHSERGDELNSIEIVDKYSCLEEPVSEDLEEYAKKLAKGAALDKHNLIWMCKKGAEWQKQQMMKNTVLETKVMMDCDGDGIETPYEEWLTLENTEILSLPDNIGLKERDKVKIIIVKED